MTPKEETTMYVTKYALSGGIKHIRGKRHGVFFYDGNWGQFVIGKTAFETFEEARTAAEKARAKRILSLEKQIAALEKLTFTKPDGAAS
jgi:hypothetical protein